MIFKGNPLIENSALGLTLSTGNLTEGFTVTNKTDSSGDSSWTPVVGDKATILDRYSQSAFTLTHSSGSVLTVEVRAYDTGVAFRYLLPQSESSYMVTGEATQFVFPTDTVAYAHVSNNQTRPQKIVVTEFTNATYQRPMTLEYKNGAALAICEANLDNYCVMTLTKDGSTPRALTTKYASSVTVAEGSPDSSPWRALVIGASLTELPENADLIQNLNEAPDEEQYKFSEWVQPGSAVRAASGMNNTAIKTIIDSASANGHKYVLLDTGWYGAEYDTTCDPRLDPDLLPEDSPLHKYILGDGIFVHTTGFDVYKDIETPGSMKVDVNIPELCAYAATKNIGIILYVNGVFFPDTRGRFTNDELFARFEEWGVAGVKPGFVKVRTQANEKIMQEVIAAAARHKLIMTIHDEYVLTGTERTFPNCLTTEGIAGDEEVRTADDVPADIATVFTRPIQGPTDHTFCYPGKATKAYALASPIVFKSGLHLLHWYGSPIGITDNIDIWKGLPGTWDELKVIDGKAYEYATFARRSGSDWYIGSLSGITRSLQIPLTFLQQDTTYVAEIYADAIGADPYASGGLSAVTGTPKANTVLEYSKYLVNSTYTLERPLEYGQGYAVKLHIASQEEIESLPYYNQGKEILTTTLAKAALLKQADYTVESWAALQLAVGQAQTMLDENDTADLVVVRQASEAINAAIAGLRTLKELAEALIKASFVPQHIYTEASLQPLLDAIAHAEELLEGGECTQQDIDDTTLAITAAIAGLVRKNDLVVTSSVYLSDMNYDTSASFAYANAIKKDVNYYNNFISLMVNGVVTVFPKGMSTHAQAEVVYNIAGLGYDLFESYIGIDNNKATQGNVIFRVYGDGVLLYESPPSGNGSQNAKFISIPIHNVSVLKLQADTAGSQDGDHATWADAKLFTVGEDPDSNITDIMVNGESLTGFRVGVTDYNIVLEDGDEIPIVAAVSPNENVTYQITQADRIPGSATVVVTRPSGIVVTYTINFRLSEFARYISDLKPVLVTTHGKTAFRDVSYEKLKMAVTAADGESAMEFDRGLGTHATTADTSRIVYDISDMNFDVFESYVGISYYKNDTRSSVIFKIYADDELAPRYVSPLMGHRTPAEFISINITGVKKLILEMDAVGNNSADHANWADAKFLKYKDGASFGSKIDSIPYVQEAFRVQITTPAGVSNLIFRDEASTEVSSTVTDRQTNSDGGYTWDVSIILETVGYGQVLGVYDVEHLLGKFALEVFPTRSGVIEPVFITTTVGKAPLLPSTVQATYDVDGSRVELSVVWDEIDSLLYAQAGDFEVQGTVEKISNKAIAYVTVTDTAATTLTGPVRVTSGAALSLTYGLSGVENILAQQVTISYDKDIFEYVDCESIEDNLVIINEKNDIDSGILKIIIASLGAENAVSGAANILNIQFITKVSGVVSDIEITSASLGNNFGNVIYAVGSVATIVVDVEKTFLAEAIETAMEVYNDAVEGLENGNYPEGLKDRLLLPAIDSAQAVYDGIATEEEVAQAIADLNAAVSDFNSFVITPSTGDFNNVQGIDIGDLGLVTYYYEKKAGDADWDAIKHVDINGDQIIGLYELAFIAKRILGK